MLLLDFPEMFRSITKHYPMPWQERLFKSLVNGAFPSALDLPTGLGKTSVMVIWLLAYAAISQCNRKKFPRRLVYVVDRRAVVDQATTEAEGLRQAIEENICLKKRLGLSGPLPLSTLRGQHADNREWLADPASPAIIVGTVDMIGSRLLFEGYGVSRRMRPYHAGLLGADTLVVLDEAHLVPPFQALLAELASARDKFGPSAREGCALPVLRLRLLSLSATGRNRSDGSCAQGSDIFTLGHEDRAHTEVKKRLGARKVLVLRAEDSELDKNSLADTLAKQAWDLANQGNNPIRCLIYADKRDIAENTKAALEKIAKPKGKGNQARADIELLVGARRVREREQVRQWLDTHGFLAGTSRKLERPAFLIATSAGEVGIDLDADHMVCDLVPWERMVQRLGRVNRRGEKNSQVIVVHGSEPELKSKDSPTEVEQRALCAWHGLALLKELPEVGDGRDASPAALLELKQRAQVCAALARQLREATTPEPLRPALTRALVDAWAMTSLDEHLGRPDIQPWLRGWVKDQPQTSVIWRHYLPVRQAGAPLPHNRAERIKIEAFFEAAPPHLSEMLETESAQVADWLKKRAKALLTKCDGPDKDREQNSDEAGSSAGPALRAQDVVALLLRQDGRLKDAFTLATLSEIQKDQLNNKLLVVDARLGGLKDGLLDDKEGSMAASADTDPAWSEMVGFRVRLERSEAEEASVAASDGGEGWLPAFAFNLTYDAEGIPQERLLVEQRAIDAQAEDARSLNYPQTLAEHQSCTESKAHDLAMRLGLDGDATEALAVAALLHDEGKRAKRWQRAFGAQRDAARYRLDPPLAKTRGPIDWAQLDGYRHEFGSLPYAQDHPRFRKLAPEWKDLVLHLIAAHHGQARPVIATSGCDDAPPSALAGRAQEVALRFAQLQRRWGPWGLAWWEALLRAADQQASRENDQRARAGLAPKVEAV